MGPRIAVVFHSRRGRMRQLAALAAEGARSGSAQVRLLRVVDADPRGTVWPEPPATPEDLLWADGTVLATPTYFGNVSAALKGFLESTGPLWRQGLLADRVVAGMTTSTRPHGGREATLLALHQTACHWGAWVAGSDPADPAVRLAGGNPYGVSASDGPGPPSGTEGAAAVALGRRLAALAARAHPVGGAPVPSLAGGRRARVAVVCGDGDGPARLLARACAAGARSTGAQVRLRQVGGAARPAGWPFVPAAPADVRWADAVVFGSRARLGGMAAHLMEFVQSLEGGGPPGPLSAKAAGGFVTTSGEHAGSESALLSLHHALLGGGAVVVPPGYTDPSVFAAGGNPYGTSHALTAGDSPTAEALEAAAHQGRRLATAGDLLRRPVAPAAERHDENVSGGGRTDERAAVRRDRRVL